MNLPKVASMFLASYMYTNYIRTYMWQAFLMHYKFLQNVNLLIRTVNVACISISIYISRVFIFLKIHAEYN